MQQMIFPLTQIPTSPVEGNGVTTQVGDENSFAPFLSQAITNTEIHTPTPKNLTQAEDIELSTKKEPITPQLLESDAIPEENTQLHISSFFPENTSIQHPLGAPSLPESQGIAFPVTESFQKIITESNLDPVLNSKFQTEKQITIPGFEKQSSDGTVQTEKGLEGITQKTFSQDLNVKIFTGNPSGEPKNNTASTNMPVNISTLSSTVQKGEKQTPDLLSNNRTSSPISTTSSNDSEQNLNAVTKSSNSNLGDNITVRAIDATLQQQLGFSEQEPLVAKQIHEILSGNEKNRLTFISQPKLTSGAELPGYISTQQLEEQEEVQPQSKILETYLSTNVVGREKENFLANTIVSESEQENSSINSIVTGRGQENSSVNSSVSGRGQEISSISSIVAESEQENSSINSSVTGRGQENSSVNSSVTGRGQEISSVNSIVTGRGQENSSVNSIVTGRGQEISSVNSIVTGRGQENSSVNSIVIGRGQEISSINSIVAASLSETSMEKQSLSGKQATRFESLRQDIHGQYFDSKVSPNQSSTANNQQQDLFSQGETNKQQEALIQTTNNGSTSTNEANSHFSMSTSPNHEQQSQGISETFKPIPFITTTAISEDELLTQVIQRFQIRSQLQNSKMTIKLHPAELGELKIEIAVKEGAVKASFMAQTQNVQEVLEKQLPKLRELMEQQGVKVDDIKVSLESDSSSKDDLFQEQFAKDTPFSPQKSRNNSQQSFDQSLEQLLTAAGGEETGINVKV